MSRAKRAVVPTSAKALSQATRNPLVVSVGLIAESCSTTSTWRQASPPSAFTWSAHALIPSIEPWNKPGDSGEPTSAMTSTVMVSEVIPTSVASKSTASHGSTSGSSGSACPTSESSMSSSMAPSPMSLIHVYVIFDVIAHVLVHVFVVHVLIHVIARAFTGGFDRGRRARIVVVVAPAGRGDKRENSQQADEPTEVLHGSPFTGPARLQDASGDMPENIVTQSATCSPYSLSPCSLPSQDAKPGGRGGTRTPGLFLVREALLPSELRARRAAPD